MEVDKKRNEQTESHVISLQGSGKSFLCREDESVLEAMIRSHLGPLHFGCHGGGCGICKARIIKGEYHILKKMSRAHISVQDESKGIMLLCCMKPISDLILSFEENIV